MHTSNAALELFGSETPTRVVENFTQHVAATFAKTKLILAGLGCEVVRSSGSSRFKEIIFRSPDGKGHRLKIQASGDHATVLIDGQRGPATMGASLEESVHRAIKTTMG